MRLRKIDQVFETAAYDSLRVAGVVFYFLDRRARRATVFYQLAPGIRNGQFHRSQPEDWVAPVLWQPAEAPKGLNSLISLQNHVKSFALHLLAGQPISTKHLRLKRLSPKLV